MNAAVVHIATRGFFDVFHFLVFGQLNAEGFFHQFALFQRRIDHVEPDHFGAQDVVHSGFGELNQAAVLQHKRFDRINRCLLHRQRGAQLFALFVFQIFQQRPQAFSRQLAQKAHEFFPLHGGGSGFQRGLLHRGKHHHAHIAGEFEQHITEALDADEADHGIAIDMRQGINNGGNISRMQVFELARKFSQILFVHDVFDQRLLGAFLAVRQVFHHLLTAQEALDLLQAFLQDFPGFALESGHVFLPPENAAGV